MAATTLTLLYDGDCPICAQYVASLRLRQNVGELRLLNARESSPERDKVERAGIDLNKGFALWVNEELYYGDRALRVLALMSSRSNLANRLNHAVFRHRLTARLLYPLLVRGRLLLLTLLGRQQMH